MKNTKENYGFISIVLHWLIALVIFGLFGLGLYMVELTYYDSLYKTLPFIHKGIGILLALVILFGFIWGKTNPRPSAVPGTTVFEARAARVVHRTLYLLILVILFSGYLIPTADGSAIDVFGIFSVPATLTTIPEQEDKAGLVHLYLAYFLISIVVLHAIAALKHHFINHDNTLRRMLGLSQKS